MKRIAALLTALSLFVAIPCFATTLTPFGKTDGISLPATRSQNANITALQTVVDKQDVTAGTVTASKTVVVDANKDIGTFRHVTLNGNVVTGTTTLSEADLAKIDGITNGTQAAGKAVVTDTNVNSGVSKVTQLWVGASGSEVQVNATPAEINQIADVSTRIVPLGATGSVPTTAEGRIIRVGQDGSANTAITLTLPEATGSGAVYRFLVNTTNTGGLVIAALTTDTMVGFVNILDLDAAAQGAYQASGTDDKITLNSTTTGGQVGDWLEFIDYADTKWAVRGSVAVPTGSNPADPFSAT